MAADVAQLVEQRFRKAWVACSSQVIGLRLNPGRSRQEERCNRCSSAPERAGWH